VKRPARGATKLTTKGVAWEARLRSAPPWQADRPPAPIRVERGGLRRRQWHACGKKTVMDDD